MFVLSLVGDTAMNADMLARIRIVVFALAGLICATYSILALATDTPNPISPWLPVASGMAAGLAMWISAMAAGQRNAGIAHDELYNLEWGRAIKFSYWFAIALYPLFGIFMALGWVSSTTAFAAMGTASGAAPLLTFCIINLRG